MPWPYLAALMVAAQRLLELRIARRNRAWALSQGAVEHGAGHYPLFFLLHVGWLLGWLLEARWRGGGLAPAWPLWLGLFLVAQLLRYQAIVTLGRRWNTRILVFPGRPPLRRGLYRWIAHPNYLAVVLELACLPLLFGAWVTATLASLLNAALLLGLRIPAESRALREAEAAQTTGEVETAALAESGEPSVQPQRKCEDRECRCAAQASR